jgi:hypothetical protein
MGLDQYAYVAARAGQNEEYWDQYELPENEKTVSKPREIAYWRKHPNLQGWMEALWQSRNTDDDSTFNGIELELTWEDLEALESDVESGNLPATSGFFFGNNSDEYYKNQDLEFIRNARSEIFLGLKIFYNSSW